MAQELSTVRTRIQGRLNTISALNGRNYKEPPDAISAPPFTVLGNAEIDFNTDMGGGRDYKFRLFIAVAEKDAQNGFSELDSYLASSGTKSLKAALEDASEAAPAPGDYTELYRFENVGHVVYRERTLIGAEALIRVPSGA